MDKKRIVASLVVFFILAALFYLQYRHWQSFDWGTFWAQTHRIKKVHVLHAIALIYIAYVLRALRWKIFLKPVRPKVKTMELVSPTLIGFTGLALLGRAGEFIRPYLIARRTDLPFSSQLAVWAVERIFDVGAFTVLDGVGDFSAQRSARDSASGVLRPVSRGRVLSDRTGAADGCGRDCDPAQWRTGGSLGGRKVRTSLLERGPQTG